MKLSSIARTSILMCAIPILFNVFFPGKIVAITMVCCYPLIAIYLVYLSQHKIDCDGKFWLQAFMFYGLVMLVRGIIDAKSYTDWTILASSGIPMLLFMHYSLYFSVINVSLFSLLRSFVWYILPMSILVFNKQNLGFWGFTHLISPIYLLLLCSFYLNNFYKLTIYVIAIISFLSDIQDRSNLVNILVSFTIGTTYFLKFLPGGLNLIKAVRISFFILPIALLFLGITDKFNIFRDGSLLVGDYTIEDKSGQRSQDLLVDSRTPIYQDVFTALKKNNAFLFGLGASGKTETTLVDFDDYDKIYSEGRPSTESGMLNYFQYGGILGVFLYSMLFLRASFFGIYKANNWLCKMVGLWLGYKFLYSFIEDTIFFSTYSLFLFVPIGICFNKELRAMSDSDIKVILNSIFKNPLERVF